MSRKPYAREIKDKSRVVNFWIGASIIALSSLAHPAMAQEKTLVEEKADEGRLDTVVVTARRRAESLQEVPIAVSAFGEGRISDLQADDVSGLQYVTPNFYFDEGDASNAVVYLRGVGQNDSLAFADAGVGVYVDDVFIARSQAAFLELFDVERVEVLRGPQGTLYGRNTIGGAVKFVSKRPTDTPEAYAEIGFGNFNSVIAKGRLSGPLIAGRVYAKGAFAFSERDGFNTNVFTERDDGDVNSLSGRAGLYFTPNDSFDFDITLDVRRDRPDTSRNPSRRTSVTGIPDPNGAPATLQTFAASQDPFQVGVNAGGLSNIDAYGVTVRASLDATEAWTLESITSYRSFDFELNLDTDGSPLKLLDVYLNQEQSQFSQELRAAYDNRGRLTFTGGLYYFHDDDLTLSGVDNLSAALFGFPVTVFGLATSSLADTNQITDSYAVFGDLSYDLSDRLSLGLGARYTIENKESSRRFENYFDPAVSVIEDTPSFLSGVGTPGVVIQGEDDFEAFTPRVSLSYKATEDLLIYGSASRGFKSGGFSGRANSDFGFQPFAPEFVWAYEAGAKSSWYDGHLVANAAYFFNDYTDIQVTSFGADPVSGVFVDLFTNAAAATIQGLELELLAKPADGLTLSMSLGLLDAQYDEFEILVGGVRTDVSDRDLVNTPEVSGSFAATYEFDLGPSLKATLHGDLAYRDSYANEVTDSTNLRQDAYWLSNAFASVKTPDNRWEVRAGIRNIGDESILVQGFNLAAFPGVETGFYGAPRTYDLRLIYRF
ncbi:TonB-dependent receptor [Hirschia maritima]|uniref:TonB-dependent receptor n=1 Tax=Hirschia maritima TaxID=1121961 RepID=UPI0003800E3B|nr:TonB-dependent receptor [Hirschia maritima]